MDVHADVLAQPAGIPDSGNGSLDGDGGVEIRFGWFLLLPLVHFRLIHLKRMYRSLTYIVPSTRSPTAPYFHLLPVSTTVVLLGVPSGGKSTIFKLLYHLYSPDTVNYLDSKNIQDISLYGIHEKLVVVGKVDEDEHCAVVSRALVKGAHVVFVKEDLDVDVLGLVNSSRTILWEVNSAHFASVQEGAD